MNDDLKTQLSGLGLTDDQVAKLEAEGVTAAEEMAMLTSDQIKATAGCTLIAAIRVARAFAPAPEPAAVPAAPAAPEAGVVDPVNTEIPEGTAPTPAHLNAYAGMLGMDPTMLMAIAMGGGGALGEMSIADMVPLGQIVPSYRPKVRNFSYILMGQLEKSLENLPIVAINDDGSINADVTIRYIQELQEGSEAAEDDLYWGPEGKAYQLIRVGVDMQSIYDADPVDPANRALQSSGMGLGRINWSNIPLDVRQVVYYAVMETNELNPADDAALGRLRDRIKPGVTRSDLRIEFPKATTRWNDANRLGNLPTLRKSMPNRRARRPEIGPRRRTGGMPRDLSDVTRGEEGRPTSAGSFR